MKTKKLLSLILALLLALGVCPLAAFAESFFVRFRKEGPHRVDPPHDVVATQEAFRPVPDHFGDLVRRVEEIVERKGDVRAVQTLLAGEVEAVAVEDAEQAGQDGRQRLRTHGPGVDG